MESKKVTIVKEDEITSVIESDCIYTLKSFYEEWSEMAEEEGENLFAVLCSGRDTDNVVIASGMIGEIFRELKDKIIKRFRVFFDNFFKEVMAEEKEPFWEVSKRWIRDYQKVIEKLHSGEAELNIHYELEYFIPDPDMWIFASWYLDMLKEVFQKLEFEYEIT